MKVASILAFAAAAIASVHATGPSGSTCEYGTPPPATPEPTTTAPPTPEPTTTAPPTPEPTTTAPPTPEPTTTAPPTPEPTTTAPPTPEPTTTAPPTPEPTTTAPPTPEPTTTAPPTPEPTTTQPPAPPGNCQLYTAETDPKPFGECVEETNNEWYKYKILGIEKEAENGGTPCPDENDPSRKAKESCPKENCTPLSPEADQGEYGACALVDGKYVKSKVLGVDKQAKYGGTCDPKDRLYTQPCTAVDCVPLKPEEDKGDFGECKERDNSGVWYKSKVLGIKTPAENGGLDCEPDDKRVYSVLCEAVDCKAVDAKDDTGAFGDCADDGTGKWFKSKVLAIKDEAIYGGKCDPKDRTVTEPCDAVNCEAYTKETDQGPFGDCKDDGTNKWYKSKILGIKTEAKYGGAQCASEEQRTVSEFCEPIPCEPVPVGEDQGDYGECSKNADGKYIKTKVLGIKEQAKYGGTCDPKDRTVEAACAGVDCVPYTLENDPGSFGECKEVENTGKFRKSKVLGIQVPEKYGGLCSTDEQRTVYEDCPAVNCKAVDPKDDTGAFGDCADDGSGKWFKSKVLAVKDEAIYGGTCDPKDRTVTESCEAIKCEAYTKETDPGNFGECKDNGSGQWFKTKVLGIKTEAKYGGQACASEEQRTISELCDPVECKAVDAKDDTGAFGDCADDGTGKWFKSKVLAIKDEAIYGGKCDPKDRTVTEPCDAVNCEAYTKETDQGPFGDCKDDGTNKWYKSKILGIKTEAKYGGAQCASEEQRTVSEFCEPIPCEPVPVGEDQGDYGECSKNADGKYIKTKVLGIKEQAKYGGTCDPKDRTVEAACAGVDCVPYTLENDPGSFGECKEVENTGKFRKSKVLGIQVPEKYGGLCSSDEQRTVYEDCLAVNCKAVDPKDDTGAFGDCADDGSGKWFKSKVLAVKDQAQNGGSCDPKDRTYSEPCVAINCEAYTKETDPGQFGECKDINNSGKFYKYKVLGIKTEAKYGGQACASEEQRTISEFCEPVNCVGVDPKDDTGAYGECKNDGTGKYYQYKVLAIKTPAKNGGTCLDKDRTVSQLCPAVPCVVYPGKEDPGQFSACVKDTSDNLYYKSKTLGIKTPALYGGSCPLETDPVRKYREQCPKVDCVVTDPAMLSWGVCTKFPDNKYYRTKVLSIVTQPLYGGKACPATADLTLKDPCPQDAYCVPPEPIYNTCVAKLGQCGAKVVDKVYRGFELQLITGLQLFECCDKCTNTAGCVAYSFTPSSTAANTQCSLKWKTDKTDKVTGAISSAPKTVKPTTCTFADNGYNTLPLKNLAEVSTGSLDVCCQACVDRPTCATFNLKDGRCELKAYNGADAIFWGDGWRAGWIPSRN